MDPDTKRLPYWPSRILYKHVWVHPLDSTLYGEFKTLLCMVWENLYETPLITVVSYQNISPLNSLPAYITKIAII